MTSLLDLQELLSPEEVVAARKVTRAPAAVEDPPLSQRAASSYRRYVEKRKLKTANHGVLDRVSEVIPAVGWLASYKWKQWLLNDVMAGICVALMVIPQGMSYAQNLAFLPQVFGIYGAFVPCLVYGVLGSSKHLAVGPVAVTSLLLGSGLTNVFGSFSINPSHPNDLYEAAVQQNYNRAAIQVSFMAGLLYTAIALLRLGWIVNYLSAPVISGFMTGAASIILSTQIKYITGQYALPRSDTLIRSLKLILDNMSLFRWPEFGTSVMFLAVLLFCQIGGNRIRKLRFLRVLGPIIVTVISLVMENAGKLYTVDYNDPTTPILQDVGPVPSGLPKVTTGWWFPLYNTTQQVILAVIICLLDITESTTVARRVAQEKRYKLNFTQELRALGITNVLGACFNCYTTTGAFSRTTVNAMAGAQSLLSSFVTGIFIMIILLFATPVFKHLSVNVQGCIIIVAVLPLFDFKAGWYYWEVNKLDFLCWLTGYTVTALAGALYGIISAFAVSIAIFVLRNGFPRITTYGKLPGTGNYVDPELYPTAETAEIEGVLVVRVEAPFFYGNLAVVKDHIEDEVTIRRVKGQQVAAVVLDMTMTPEIDGAYCHTLKYYLQELKDDGITLIMASPSKSVVLTLQRSSLLVQMRPENLQLTMDEALERARAVVADSISPLSSAEKSA